jgi:hypothetical protein
MEGSDQGGREGQKVGHGQQHYAPRGASDTPGGYPSAGGAFIVVKR